MTAKLPANWDQMTKAEKVAYANKVLNAPKSSATPASWGSAGKESKVVLAKTHFSSSPRYGSQVVPTPKPSMKGIKPMPLPQKPKTGARGPVKEGKLVIHNLKQRKGVTNRRAKP